MKKEYVMKGGDIVRITKGRWADYDSDHFYDEGDVCIVELIDNEYPSHINMEKTNCFLGRILRPNKTDDDNLQFVMFDDVGDVLSHREKVNLFMKFAKQEVATSKSIRKLRASLILEEAIETVNSLGFNVGCRDIYGKLDGGAILLESESDYDEASFLDGIADLNVVMTGSLIQLGIDKELMDEVQLAVDSANLTKFGEGHSYREDGKLIKPEGWKHPDIASIIGKYKKAKNEG